MPFSLASSRSSIRMDMVEHRYALPLVSILASLVFGGGNPITAPSRIRHAMRRQRLRLNSSGHRPSSHDLGIGECEADHSGILVAVEGTIETFVGKLLRHDMNGVATKN